MKDQGWTNETCYRDEMVSGFCKENEVSSYYLNWNAKEYANLCFTHVGKKTL